MPLGRCHTGSKDRSILGWCRAEIRTLRKTRLFGRCNPSGNQHQRHHGEPTCWSSHSRPPCRDCTDCAIEKNYGGPLNRFARRGRKSPQLASFHILCISTRGWQRKTSGQKQNQITFCLSARFCFFLFCRACLFADLGIVSFSILVFFLMGMIMCMVMWTRMYKPRLQIAAPYLD